MRDKESYECFETAVRRSVVAEKFNDGESTIASVLAKLRSYKRLPGSVPGIDKRIVRKTRKQK